MRTRFLVASIGVLGLSSACGRSERARVDWIVGDWETTTFAMREGGVSKGPFSYDDVDPASHIEVRFREDGLFTFRQEGHGHVVSVVGTWRPASSTTGKPATSYRLRIAMVNGVRVSPEARDDVVDASFVAGRPVARDSAYLSSPSSDPGRRKLVMPIAVDTSKNRFENLWGSLKRRTDP